MKFKKNKMICKKHKPAYPWFSNDKSTTSTEHTEHKKGVSLFKRLTISSLLESSWLFGYISVSDGKIIRLKHILKGTIQ